MFIDEMMRIKGILEEFGHAVHTPPMEVPDGQGGMISVSDRYKASKEAGGGDVLIWDMREMAMKNFLKKVEWADVLIVANEDKRGAAGYIGANTLIEMGVAFHLDKPIYLKNEVPDLPCKEEIWGMKPTILNGDFSCFASVDSVLAKKTV
jgi:hypothetical protein